jgi:hypothetical protein
LLGIPDAAGVVNDLANVLAAIERACTARALPKATRLAVLLASYQYFQSRLDDTERAWRAILNAARQAGDVTTAAHAELSSQLICA